MIRMSQIDFDTIIMRGGWDQKTPTLSLPPGFVRSTLNYEINAMGGYSRIAGYERFDGRPKPSDAIYKTVFIGSFVNIPTSGQTITGGTSGATGVVIATGANYVVVTAVIGTFAIGENITVGALQVGVSIVPTTSMTSKNHAIYTGMAADQYRANIQAVPGSGAALGCFLYNDVVYAFRANAGGTAVNLYKSSTGGWVQVNFYNELAFNAGSVMPPDGATITQGSVTATIKRVCTEGGYDATTGGWVANTGSGRFIVTTPTGGTGNFVAGAANITWTGGGSAVANLVGAQTAITLTPGGKFEFDFGNFYGGATTNRVYGCDGINHCFEFDGDVLAPIHTGASTDNPKHIQFHKNTLFVTIGASLLGSSPFIPWLWSTTYGAFEDGVGEELTGLKVLPGSQSTAAMLVTSHESTYVLYGTASSNFQLIEFNTGTGAIHYTLQNMNDSYAMDDRGVLTLQATLNYGNFNASTLTFNINDFIGQERTKVSYSCLDRSKSQYRIFFNDGYALYITSVNGRWLGNMPIYFPNPVYMAFEGKYSTGEEADFFCSTNGFVYQFDKGTSFDGANLDAYFTLNYNSSQSPRYRKRYRKCAVEISGGGYAEISFGYLLGYSSASIAQSLPVTYANAVQMMQWDNFTWDNFSWDGGSMQAPQECGMDGRAENVALTFRSSSAYFQPFTINSAIIHYSLGRPMR